MTISYRLYIVGLLYLTIHVIATLSNSGDPVHLDNARDLTATGATYRIGNLDYFAHPVPCGSLNTSSIKSANSVPGAQHHPLTVIVTDDSTFSEANLHRTIESYKARDDVFQESFLRVIYIRYNGSGDPGQMGSFANVQNRYNSPIFIFSQSRSGKDDVDLAPGPYFLDPVTGNAHRAYRLYSDTQGAFVAGLVARPNGKFDILPASVPGAESATSGVPSRLYFERTSEKPLAGYRFGAKDILDVAGVKTSCGNRAYYALYPPPNATAPAVQTLLDKGAVLVGKMRTSQFANGEVATADWVDYPEPFNPRGDGYQDTSSSSSGPAAGIASYDWLDFSIGSDTGGSVRGPAGVQGIYGNRPSHGAVSLERVMPLCSAMDTAGILARDADLWRSVARVWYAQFRDYNEYPSRLVYPKEYFSIAPPGTPAGDLIEGFVSNLEHFLRARRDIIRLQDLWNSTRPSSGHPSLDEMLNTTYSALISIDQINLLGNSFFADYAKLHGGRKPFLDPSTEVRWNWARSQPPGTFDEAMANKTIFKDWFSTHVVSSDSRTCSDSLFIYPLKIGDPVYRNVYWDPPVPPFGFTNMEVSCFADTPDHLVPVGQIPYNSTITGKTEYLPVAVSLLAAKGCDFMLYNLIVDLQKTGILSAVQTGRTI